MRGRQYPVRRHQLSLAAIVVLSLGVRVWGLTWGLYDATVSRRPHPDEWPVYWLFHWFGSNHNLDPCPHPPGACFFDWGTVYPYTAYLVRLIISPVETFIPARTFGQHADMEFVWAVIAGRLTSAILSTATVFVVYLLAARAFNPPAGIMAALVMAISALPMQLAHFATPDSATVFLLTSTLLFAVQASDKPTPVRFALAGAFMGLSTGSEYHMVLLAVPLGTVWLLSRGARQGRNIAVAVACALFAYLMSGVYAVIHLSDFVAATEHTLRIRTVDSSLQYGDRWTKFGPAWLYVIRFPLGYGVGFALTGWMLVAVAWSLWRRTRADWILLSWVVVYFLLVTLSPAKFMRYSAPLLPVMAVLSGRFLVESWDSARRATRVPLAGTAAAVIAISIVYDGAYVGLFASTDPRTVAEQWIGRHAAGAPNLSFDQLPNGLINLPYFFDSGAYRLCFTEFRPAALHNPARYVLTDSYDMEEHPRIAQARVDSFDRSLGQSSQYRVVLRVHRVPTFLGASFDIDASPHDWRYPSHTITIYEKTPSAAGAGEGTCFRSLASAHAALYPHGGGG